MANTTSSPRFVSENTVLVTKAFAKNAKIFGTPEYKLWKEIRTDCPEAKMVCKKIKTNPNKKNNTKNMTYENMALFINAQANATTLMAEFQQQIILSKIQTNPYRYVLAWFIQKFENYDNGYKAFFQQKANEDAANTALMATSITNNLLHFASAQTDEAEYEEAG